MSRVTDHAMPKLPKPIQLDKPKQKRAELFWRGPTAAASRSGLSQQPLLLGQVKLPSGPCWTESLRPPPHALRTQGGEGGKQKVLSASPWMLQANIGSDK